MYQSIDQIETGVKLEMLIKSAGYKVKDIQKYLYLSCPQPIYRWFKGKILPSVEHLYALSKLLNVHMEDLLVMQGQSVKEDIGKVYTSNCLAKLDYLSNDKLYMVNYPLIIKLKQLQ